MHIKLYYIMKTTTLIVLIAVLLACQCFDDLTFDEFKVRFNKSYKSREEEAKYRAQYQTEVSRIKKWNQQNHEFTEGINYFTDLTKDQRQKFAGLRPQRVIEPQQSEKENKPHLKATSLGAVPLQVDWRTEGKVSVVKNQGTCGSCWAFTTAALFQSIYMIGGSPQIDTSEQFILQCTTQNSPGQTLSSCGGGILEYAIPFILRNGIPFEAEFPYTAANYGSNPGYPNTTGICTATNLTRDNITGVYIGTHSNLTDAQMQELLSYAPVTAAMYAGGAFMTYSSGVYTGCPDAATSIASLNHAVLVVGYDSNGNYIIKNSWSTSWGQNGYAVISKTNDCGLKYSPRQIRGTNAQLVSTSGESKIFMVISFLIFCLALTF